MTEFDVLAAAASGMDAQRAALDVAARNVAAAEAGGAFARLVPRFQIRTPDDSGMPDAEAPGLLSDDVDSADYKDGVVRFTGTTSLRGVDPDAVTEMVAVLNAQRAYEANASVFDAGKRLAERTIDLARP
jgi:flagellar basal body rod protein FlgC